VRSAAEPPILFLEIDGVLLSGRAWLMPRNRALRAWTATMKPRDAFSEVGRDAVFDPCAIALLVQICEATGARLVVSSGWRYTVGVAETRAKLVEQGVGENLFHENWACPHQRHGQPDKYVDIQNWLEGHGAREPGSWLVLDDEPGATPDPTLLLDSMEGLGVRGAAAAIRYFGAVSGALGMVPLLEEDIPAAVIKTFSGHWIGACRWLEGANAAPSSRPSPSRLLALGKREEALRRLPDAVRGSEEGKSDGGNARINPSGGPSW
jgi:hypothetical protein